MPNKFEFYEKVKVTPQNPDRSNLVGTEGIVHGFRKDEDGQYVYSVFMPELGSSLNFRESELQSTGQSVSVQTYRQLVGNVSDNKNVNTTATERVNIQKDSPQVSAYSKGNKHVGTHGQSKSTSLFCPHCGTQLLSSAKFCHGCGESIQITTPLQKSVSTPKQTTTARHVDSIRSDRNCPVCQKDDKAQSAKSIVFGQTHDIQGGSHNTQVYVDKEGKKRYESHYTPHSAIQMSLLAQRLSPPGKPEAGDNCLGVIGAIGLGLIGVLLLLIGGAIGAGGITFFGLLLIGGGILIYIKSNDAHDQEVMKAKREMPLWRNAITRWEQLYYCERDDCIYIPGENTSSSADRLTSYVYSR